MTAVLRNDQPMQESTTTATELEQVISRARCILRQARVKLIQDSPNGSFKWEMRFHISEPIARPIPARAPNRCGTAF